MFRTGIGLILVAGLLAGRRPVHAGPSALLLGIFQDGKPQAVASEAVSQRLGRLGYQINRIQSAATPDELLCSTAKCMAAFAQREGADILIASRIAASEDIRAAEVWLYVARHKTLQTRK